MKQVQMPMPELGLIAATRGILGAGAGLLLAEKLPQDKRKIVGWTLFLVGAGSTIPLAFDVLHKRTHDEPPADSLDGLPSQEI